MHQIVLYFHLTKSPTTQQSNDFLLSGSSELLFLSLSVICLHVWRCFFLHKIVFLPFPFSISPGVYPLNTRLCNTFFSCLGICLTLSMYNSHSFSKSTRYPSSILNRFSLPPSSYLSFPFPRVPSLPLPADVPVRNIQSVFETLPISQQPRHGM